MGEICFLTKKKSFYPEAEKIWMAQEKAVRDGFIMEFSAKRTFKHCKSQGDLLRAFRELSGSSILVLSDLELVESFEEFYKAFMQRSADNLTVRVLSPEMKLRADSREARNTFESLIRVEARSGKTRGTGQFGKPPLDPEKVEAIRKDRRAGKKISEIMKEHVVSSATVYKYSKGLKPKRVLKKKYEVFLKEPEKARHITGIPQGYLMGAYRRFLRSRGSESTRKSYLREFECFLSFVRKKTGITPEHPEHFLIEWFQDYRDYLESEGGSASSIRKKIYSLRSFFTWLIRAGEATKNPAVEVAVPRVRGGGSVLTEPLSRRDLKALNDTALENFRQAPSGYKKDLAIRNLALVYCMPLLGVRYAALTGLRLKDFTESEGNYRLRFRESKQTTNKKAGEISLGIDVKAGRMLRDFIKIAHKESSPEDWIFFGKSRDNRISNAGINNMLERLRKKAGVETGVKTHRFRSTFATENADKMSERELQLRMMHADSRMTKKYDKPHLKSRDAEWLEEMTIDPGGDENDF